MDVTPELNQLLLGFRVITVADDCVELERVVQFRGLKIAAFLLSGLFMASVIGMIAGVYFGIIPGEISENPPGSGPWAALFGGWFTVWLIWNAIILCGERETWCFSRYTLRITKTLFGHQRTAQYSQSDLSCQSVHSGGWAVCARASRVLYSGTDADLLCKYFQIRSIQE